MHNAKRSIPIFLLAALISLKAFPEPNRGGSNRLQFADLASFAILEEAALAQLDGGDLILAVDRQAKTTVSMTAEMVRNKNVSPTNPKDAMGESKREVPIRKNGSCLPFQKPMRLYVLDSTKINVGGLGSGSNIAATAGTPIVGKTNLYQATDLHAHSTSYENPNGCVGVKTGMDSVINTYTNTGGTKTISVTSHSEPMSASSVVSSSGATAISCLNPWHKFW